MLYPWKLSRGLMFVRSSVRSFVRKLFLVNTLQSTIFVLSSSNLVTTYINLKSRTSSILVKIGFKMADWRPYLLAKSTFFPCEHSTVHNFCPIVFKFGDNLYEPKILEEFDIVENRIQDGRLTAIFVRKIYIFCILVHKLLSYHLQI